MTGHLQEASGFIQLEKLYKHFGPQLTLGDKIAHRLGAKVETRSVRAVDNVSLAIARGQTLGLVGESGCGKSTLGRMVAGIIAPDKGSVQVDNAPVMSGGLKVDTRVQMIFQDPFASLDPRMRIGDIVSEGPLVHGLTDKENAADYAAGYLVRAGLDPSLARRFPHQFSGGQRQRIAIARALAMQPEVLVCDEPVASLDVSIQAQIINLFLKLQRDLGLTLIFISHDLSVVRHLSDRVAVMYLGKIVEEGPAEQVYTAPCHPYTKGLLASVPRLVLDEDALVTLDVIKGEIPSPLSPPEGCNFSPRCPIFTEECRKRDPQLREIKPSQFAACHFAK
ncbi:ABC transporter ATP-binding protein [Pseudahrensia aquimaris]|uniref:ABC transporter ATP-binding protein n=1 Tax=Pseudahrensia aquimaris TaxID=744461 RepID=A0ABW3FEI4_9HYPH